MQIADHGPAGAMAPKATAAPKDDLSVGLADAMVRFGLAGVQHEIDLSNQNAAGFRRKFTPLPGKSAGRDRGSLWFLQFAGPLITGGSR